MPKIPKCPEDLPSELRRYARELSEAWLRSDLRPKFEIRVARDWDELIRDWVSDDTMPLYIRKHRNNRGSLIEHNSGRMLIPTDNSVAHWCSVRAFECTVPSLQDIEAWQGADEIPIAYALGGAEGAEARYRCTISVLRQSLNDLGWSVRHIEPVGILPQRTQIEEIPIECLKEHFVRLLSPSNMFLVPKIWAGLGELPEMLEVARRFAPRGELIRLTAPRPTQLPQAVQSER